jgi:hypothetical protein
MRNLDAIINQLANEQQRTEHLLVEDLKAIRQEAQLFFDKQARELQSFYDQKQKDADGYMGLLVLRFEDVINRIQNGYPKEKGFGELTEDPVPEFLTRPKMPSKVTDEVMAALAQTMETPSKGAE